MDRFIGKRLDGRYEIREILGIGGMAVVYKAYDNLNDRIVAIKILKEEYATNEDFLRRFKNESKAISLLSHQNIVKIFDVSFGDLIQYIVMEYIDGITLKEYIERQGILSWKEAVHFTTQILRALQHAHDRGIVHRDVKPQNIMVLPDGTIKVTDFGIARFARSEQRTITDKAIGSVHYISPEQARGEAADEKADIYSVGVMLYEMLTGQLPFEAESAVSVAIMQLQRDPRPLTEVNGAIPIGLEQITMHAMQKETANRYTSSSEMLCDLEKFRKDPSATFEYTYFVDNAPTRYIDTSDVVDEPEDAEKPEKAPVVPILAGVAITFAVAILAVFFIFILPKFTGSTGKEIPCPNFIGKSYKDIDADTEVKDNFEISIKWDNNSEFSYGVIYKQSQPENKKLKKGAPIVLWASMGPKTVKVPDVSGSNETYAVSKLRSEGFSVVVAEKADENTQQGLVINTVPAANESVAGGSEITVYISTGAPTVYVPLPNVVGLKAEYAKKIIVAKGLIVGNVTEVDNSSLPAGYVATQTPSTEDAEKVGKGTAVDLGISSGKTKYTADIEFAIPEGVTGISLWINGEMQQESAALDGTAAKYTFKGVTAASQKVSAEIKIKNAKHKTYTSYAKVTLDLVNGTASVYSGPFNIN